MKKRFVQEIILTGVIGVSVGALSTSAQITEAQFSARQNTKWP
jgi:hypothetical protein